MASAAVSVIIPCYRATATLQTAVRSVLAQSFADFELVIVDDGSPDATRLMAEQLAETDSRIRVICQNNAGPAAARNLGLSHSHAPIVAFLDADDRWTPDLLAQHVARFHAHAECGVSFARIRFFDPFLLQPGRVSAAVGQLKLAHVLGENPTCTTSNIVARRTVFEAVGGFDEKLTHGEDQEWIARVLATTSWLVSGLPRVLVHYRTSPAGLSADLERTRSGWLAMLDCVRVYAPQAVADAEPEAAALFNRFLARRALRTGQARAAIRPMLQAWRSSPMALITRQPIRTMMTTAGALAALLPGNPARALLAR